MKHIHDLGAEVGIETLGAVAHYAVFRNVAGRVVRVVFLALALFTMPMIVYFSSRLQNKTCS